MSNWPLGAYRSLSFYTMRLDALDRFGTRLEQRSTRAQVEDMMAAAGLADIRFSEAEPLLGRLAASSGGVRELDLFRFGHASRRRSPCSRLSRFDF